MRHKKERYPTVLLKKIINEIVDTFSIDPEELYLAEDGERNLVRIKTTHSFQILEISVSYWIATLCYEATVINLNNFSIPSMFELRQENSLKVEPIWTLTRD